MTAESRALECQAIFLLGMAWSWQMREGAAEVAAVVLYAVPLCLDPRS